MNISRRTLNTFFPAGFAGTPTSEVVNACNELGLAVGGVNPIFARLERVVVAKVVGIRPHPQADRLRLCDVYVGSETLPIVCGASNFEIGDYVPLALVGAQLPNGVSIAPAVIRGQKSEGMICSLKELGIGEGDGIWNLSADTKTYLGKHLGMPVGMVLGLTDEVLTLELTPNRGDCLSYFGVARELAPYFGLRVRLPLPRHPEEQSDEGSRRDRLDPSAIHGLRMTDGAVSSDAQMRITVEPDVVSAFYLQMWEQPWDPTTQVPFVLRWKLWLHGFSTIHPLVDVANWVMLECGQPLHVYDVAKVQGPLTVRLASVGEKADTLSGEHVAFVGNEVVIADGQKILCVGGVIGMKEAGVDQATTQVWIEAAHFHPLSVRRTKRQLRVQTESAHRFERGVDPTLPGYALKRFSQLMQSYFGFNGAHTTVPLRAYVPQIKPLSVKPAQVLAWVPGPTTKDMRRILTGFGFGIKGTSNTWQVTVPSHRFDVEGEWDIAEEVARGYGYNRIPDAKAIVSRMDRPSLGQNHFILRRSFQITDQLVGLGYHENVHVASLSRHVWEPWLKPMVDTPEWVMIANPVNRERNGMPPALFPLLLERFMWLRDRQMPVVKICEMGKVFRKTDTGFSESLHLAMLMSVSEDGTESHLLHPIWETKSTIPHAAFLRFLGDVQSVLSAVGRESMQRISVPSEKGADEEGAGLFHPYVCQHVKHGETMLGVVAQIHPNHEVMKKHKRLRCYVAEIFLEDLLKLPLDERSVVPPSVFPGVARDMSVRMIDAQWSFGDLMQKVQGAVPSQCVRMQLLDRFVEPTGHVSFTIRFWYEHPQHSLSDAEVNAMHTTFRDSLKRSSPIEYR